MPLQNTISPLSGRHIVCLTRYGLKGPSSRLRFHQYQPKLEQAGARVSFFPLLSDHYLERLYAGEERDKIDISTSYIRRLAQLATMEADLVWVEKELFPFLPGFVEAMLRLRSFPYVVDFDDAIFHNYDLNENKILRWLLANKLGPLLSASALVTAGNAYLADYARAHGAPSVAIIPTVVDTLRYPVHSPVSTGRIRIGWIGTPTNKRYLAPVVRALEQLSDKLPLTLVTVGAGELKGLSIDHEQHDWAEDCEGELVAGFDIGVMPLADTPWERGKCGYKLIQYMAAARPVIASSVGVNSEIVTHEVGRLVSEEADWARAIYELATDGELRARLGGNARRRVEDHYSLDSTAPKLLGLLSEVLSARSYPRRTSVRS